MATLTTSLGLGNPTPRFQNTGFRDESAATVVPEQLTLPAFLPIFFIQADGGDHEKPMWVKSAMLESIFGKKTFRHGGEYYSHQNAFLRLAVASNQESVIVRRLVGDSASYATLRLCVEVIPVEVPQYLRDISGDYLLDASGLRQPDAGAAKVNGYKLRWFVEEATTNFASASKRDGTVVDQATGAKSTIYPIMDLKGRWVGRRGRNSGIRLMSTDTKKDISFSEDIVNNTGSRLYFMQAVTRETTNGTVSIAQANVYPTIHAQFMFSSSAVDEDTGLEYSANIILNNYWESSGIFKTAYSPFSKVHAYNAFAKEVCELLYAVEEPFGLVATSTQTETPAETIDIFTARSVEGYPYYSIAIATPSEGGLSLDGTSTMWLQGGDDGIMDNDTYEEKVRNELISFQNENSFYRDANVYPFSTAIDSGFSVATKKEFRSVVYRDDCWPLLGVHKFGDPALSAETESSIAYMLRTYLSHIKESSIFNTSACRGVVTKHSGIMSTLQLDGRVPLLTAQILSALSNYAGSDSGILRKAKVFEELENKTITGFTDLNVEFLGVSAKTRDAVNGITYAQSREPDTFFVPVYRTIYDDASSVLADVFTMHIAARSALIGEKGWQLVVGNPTLEPDEACRISANYVQTELNRTYGGRCRITVNCYMDDYDKNLGWHYRTEVRLEANVSLKVNTFTVISKRYSNATTTQG